MDRCPSCRARVDGGDNCRRCGMSLGLLYKIEDATEIWLSVALNQLISDDAAAASASLRQLLALRRDPLAELLLHFAEIEPTPPERPPGDPGQPDSDWLSKVGWSMPSWWYGIE